MDAVQTAALSREAEAGFRPPVSGTPTHGRKSAPVDVSRLDLGALRPLRPGWTCTFCGHQHRLVLREDGRVECRKASECCTRVLQQEGR